MLEWGRFQGWLTGYLRSQRGALIWLVALFGAGLVFGGLAVGALPHRDRLELLAFLGNLIEQVALGGGPLAKGALFQASLLAHLRLLLLIWVLGLTVAGALLVFGLAFLRGFLLGFAVSFLGGQLGLKGVALALGAVIPQGLLTVIALCLTGAAALDFASGRLKAWLSKTKGGYYEAVSQYTLVVTTGGLILLLASVTEAFLSTSLLQWLS